MEKRSQGESFLRRLEGHIIQLLDNYAHRNGEDPRYLGKLGIAYIDLDFDRHKIIKHLASRGKAILKKDKQKQEDAERKI